MRKIFFPAVSLVFFITLCFACGGRLPSPKKAGDLAVSYFKKYGKQYKESAFGKNRVSEVEILETQEIHKHLVQTTAFVSLGPSEIFKVRLTLQKKPFGWKIIAWENLAGGQKE